MSLDMRIVSRLALGDVQLHDQPNIIQYFERAVDRGEAHRRVGLLDLEVCLLRRWMFVIA